MSKTRFGSQRVIVDGFEEKKLILKKNVNGTREGSPPPPIAKVMKNDHF